jgi:hypothetical protein
MFEPVRDRPKTKKSLVVAPSLPVTSLPLNGQQGRRTAAGRTEVRQPGAYGISSVHACPLSLPVGRVGLTGHSLGRSPSVWRQLAKAVVGGLEGM